MQGPLILRRTAGLGWALASLHLLGACSESSSFQRDFVRSCGLGGAPESFCTCAYKRISRQYSDQEMRAFEGAQAGQAQTYLRDLQSTMRSCADT